MALAGVFRRPHRRDGSSRTRHSWNPVFPKDLLSFFPPPTTMTMRIQRTNSSTLHPPPPPPPWHTHLTLDTLTLVLSTTLFHPFLASLLPLCLRALATPYTSPSFIVTSGFAACVCLYWILVGVSKRYAYGPPRRLDWENEVVVITGGKGGLGGCLAEIFSLRGVAVAVMDVDIPLDCRGEGVEEEGVVYYHCDVGDPEQVERVWGMVVRDVCCRIRKCPRVYILIDCLVIDRCAYHFDQQRRDSAQWQLYEDPAAGCRCDVQN